MPELILPDLYRIEVPLPKSPLKIVNCYVIKGEDRDLVVDTGMNRPECKEVMDAALDELGVDRAKTDFFITHLHSDHMGLVSHLATETSTIYFNRIESEMLEKGRKPGGFRSRMAGFARMTGFSDKEIEAAFSDHPGFKYQAPNPMDLTILDEGDPLNIGQYRFECVQTPGHSPGHMCLYDREKKLMICGDHVLEEITPNITAWTEDDDPLRDYLASLDKVYKLDVDLGLPGHRRMVRDFRGRIEELKQHHKERLEEVLGLMDGTAPTAHDVAKRMKWNMKYDHWDDVHPMQKWFATGEAIAHLRHLEGQGLLRSEVQDGKKVFSAA